MPLSLDQIKKHWLRLAQEHGQGTLATTKTSSAKDMEINALIRAFRQILKAKNNLKSVLEVGCGNGQNSIPLAQEFQNLKFEGFDYIPDMIDAANRKKTSLKIPDKRLSFAVNDVTKLEHLSSMYDIIFSVRCLINLNKIELQKQAITLLCTKLQVGGYILLIENSQQTYALQNETRMAVGLPPRTPAEYNLFLDENVILPHTEAQNMKLIEIEDFISLHDIVLYVLTPLINNGEVDYSHPLVEAATAVNIAISETSKDQFGKFGQNRLYVFQKIK